MPRGITTALVSICIALNLIRSLDYCYQSPDDNTCTIGSTSKDAREVIWYTRISNTGEVCENIACSTLESTPPAITDTPIPIAWLLDLSIN